MILGTSRGGTTIMAAALGAHPLITILDEDMTGAFDKVVGGKTPGVKLCVPNQIEIEKRWHPIFYIGLSNGRFRKSLLMNKVPRSKLNIHDYTQYGDIKHICILRHPAGVIPSIMNRENRSQDVALYRWKRTVEIFNELYNTPAYSPVFISFEKLIKTPEKTLRSLCENLGVNYSEEMLTAPSKNSRYTKNSFDFSKAQYQDEEAIWDIIPDSIRSLYKTIDEKTL